MRDYYCFNALSVGKDSKKLSEPEFWLLYYLYCGLSASELVSRLGASRKMISYYKRKLMHRFSLENDKMLANWLTNLKIKQG